MIRNFFVIAWRNIFRSKLHSIINVAGLALAIACAILIVLYTRDEASYDRFHTKADHIYRLTADFTDAEGKIKGRNGVSGMVHGPAFTRNIPEIDSFVRIKSEFYSVRVKGEVFAQEAFMTDENFFAVFDFPLLHGHPDAALQDVHALVLSEEVAEKFFGSKDVVGRTLELNMQDSFVPFTVSAVAKKSPQNSSIKLAMVLPMKASNEFNDDQWINFWMNTFLVLRSDANIDRVIAKMDQVYNREAKTQIEEAKTKYDWKETMHFGLQPLLDMHLSTDYGANNGLRDASNPMYSYMLSAIAIFIMLIACINFINLSIGRSMRRAKEVGIRKVVGSSRKQLQWQFLGESYLLTAIAFVAGLALAQALLPFFNSLANKSLSFSYLLDAGLVFTLMVLFFITGLLAGFYPAIVLSAFDPVTTLYNKIRFAGKGYLAKALVVLQFAMATLLIIGTMAMYAQFNFLTHYTLGYNDKHLIEVNIPNSDYNKAKRLAGYFAQLQGVEKIAIKNVGFNYTGGKVDGKTVDFAFDAIDENYLPTLEIPIVTGRNFSRDYSGDTMSNVLVNETFAKQMGWADAIGKQIAFWNDKQLQVIGVVADYHFSSLKEKIGPQLFVMGGDRNYGLLELKINPNQIPEALRQIEQTYRRIIPTKAYAYEFRDQLNANEYEQESKWRMMLLFGAAVTIFISCIGLFGLSVLNAEKRRKEVGIRKVLGASVAQLTSRMTLEFLALVAIALCIALPASWWLVRMWLENYPYRIGLHWPLFAAAAAVVITLAIITVVFKAAQSAMSNPVNSLRTE